MTRQVALGGGGAHPLVGLGVGTAGAEGTCLTGDDFMGLGTVFHVRGPTLLHTQM